MNPGLTRVVPNHTLHLLDTRRQDRGVTAIGVLERQRIPWLPIYIHIYATYMHTYIHLGPRACPHVHIYVYRYGLTRTCIGVNPSRGARIWTVTT